MPIPCRNGPNPYVEEKANTIIIPTKTWGTIIGMSMIASMTSFNLKSFLARR